MMEECLNHLKPLGAEVNKITVPVLQWDGETGGITSIDTALLDNKPIDLIDPNISSGVVRSDQNVSSNVLAVTNLYIEIATLQGQAFAPTQLNSVLTSIREGGKIKQIFDLTEVK